MIDLDKYLPAIVVGDTHAFSAWMAVAEPLIRESLRRYARCADVEAVLQEALLRAWQVAPKVVPDGHPNSLLRVALRAARNLALSEARRFRLAPALDDDFEQRLSTLAVEAPCEPDPLLRRWIDLCHQKLPAKPAQALEQRLLSAGGEADSTLAQRIGMQLNTFLQNITRARQLLAKCLEANGVDLTKEIA